MAYTTFPILASTLLEISKLRSRDNVNARTGTGFQDIDDALRGGLQVGSMTCISGERETGKTLIALHTAISLLLSRPTPQVAFIDTTGGFDVLRLYEAIKLRLQARKAARRVSVNSNLNPQVFNRLDDTEDVDQLAEKVLERVKIMRVFDFVGVSEAINELRDEIKACAQTEQSGVAGTTQKTHIDDSENEDDEDIMLLDGTTDDDKHQQTAAPREAVSMLIIDNISHVINPILKTNYVQGQSLLTTFMRSLSRFTKSEQLTTMVINTATTSRPLNAVFARIANPSDLPPSTNIPDPSGPTPKFEDQPSIFASTFARPGLGDRFASLFDLHLLLSQIPKRRRDAEILVGGKPGTAETVNVIEVLADRTGDRYGRYARFSIKGGLELHAPL